MKMIFAGLAALWLAWMWDRLLQRLGTPELLRVGWLVPCGEELIKFGTAANFGCAYFWLHPLFGLGEGLYETYRLFQAFRPIPVLLATGTHLIFGISYVTPLEPQFSLLLAVALHTAWNHWVILKAR